MEIKELRDTLLKEATIAQTTGSFSDFKNSIKKALEEDDPITVVISKVEGIDIENSKNAISWTIK